MGCETDPPKSYGNLGLNIHTVTPLDGCGWKDEIIINPDPPTHKRHRRGLLFVVKAKEHKRKPEYQQLPLPGTPC